MPLKVPEMPLKAHASSAVSVKNRSSTALWTLVWIRLQKQNKELYLYYPFTSET
jgi:hypothetical protein